MQKIAQGFPCRRFHTTHGPWDPQRGRHRVLEGRRDGSQDLALAIGRGTARSDGNGRTRTPWSAIRVEARSRAVRRRPRSNLHVRSPHTFHSKTSFSRFRTRGCNNALARTCAPVSPPGFLPRVWMRTSPRSIAKFKGEILRDCVPSSIPFRRSFPSPFGSNRKGIEPKGDRSLSLLSIPNQPGYVWVTLLSLGGGTIPGRGWIRFPPRRSPLSKDIVDPFLPWVNPNGCTPTPSPFVLAPPQTHEVRRSRDDGGAKRGRGSKRKAWRDLLDAWKETQTMRSRGNEGNVHDQGHAAADRVGFDGPSEMNDAMEGKRRHGRRNTNEIATDEQDERAGSSPAWHEAALGPVQVEPRTPWESPKRAPSARASS